MADYKEIIAGTINSIVDKVKSVTETGTVRDFYDKGTSRAKSYGQIAKLTLELNGKNEELKKVYAEIGRLYFEMAKDAPEGYFAPLFAQTEELLAAIEAGQDEISTLKADLSEKTDDIEVEVCGCEKADAVEDIEVEICEFEDVVAADEEENK